MRKGHQIIEFVDFKSLETQAYNLQDYSCILVVPDNIEEDLIMHTAEHLLLRGCKDYHFEGKEAARWHYLFDLADIRLNGEETETVALTSTIESFHEIPEELCVCRMKVIVVADAGETMDMCQKLMEAYEEE